MTWNLNCRFRKFKIALSFWEDKQTQPRLLLLANFKSHTCLPPEIPREIAFIPSILKGMQRWWVSWIRSISWIKVKTMREPRGPSGQSLSLVTNMKWLGVFLSPPSWMSILGLLSALYCWYPFNTHGWRQTKWDKVWAWTERSKVWGVTNFTHF